MEAVGLIGVTGERAEGWGGLMGDRFVGEATVRDERLREREARMCIGSSMW